MLPPGFLFGVMLPLFHLAYFVYMKYLKPYPLYFLVPLMIIISCGESQIQMPKPRAYPRVTFPEKKYKTFDPEQCPYKFEYPAYAKIEKENYYFDEKAPNECWYNIVFPAFKGKIYLTYYPIHGPKDFDKYINDSFELVAKHDIKASARKDIAVKNKYGTRGVLFKIKGNVATQSQFFLTDSTRNFIRGVLYFKSRVNPDSIRIIQDFIDKDIEHLLNTFEWKDVQGRD